MVQDRTPRRASLVFPILLIAVGAIILYSNWRPSFDPWPILWTYWPLILVFIGAGKIYDSWQRRKNRDAPTSGSSLGATVGAVAFYSSPGPSWWPLPSIGRRWRRAMRPRNSILV